MLKSLLTRVLLPFFIIFTKKYERLLFRSKHLPFLPEAEVACSFLPPKSNCLNALAMNKPAEALPEPLCLLKREATNG